jgi:hypothetical protein
VPSLTHSRRVLQQLITYIGLDVHKKTLAVALAMDALTIRVATPDEAMAWNASAASPGACRTSGPTPTRTTTPPTSLSCAST